MAISEFFFDCWNAVWHANWREGFGPGGKKTLVANVSPVGTEDVRCIHLRNPPPPSGKFSAPGCLRPIEVVR